MPNRNLTRRRLIAIVATAAGSAFLTGGRTAQAGEPVRWHGSALGAQVSIEIHHPHRAEAERLVERCIQDVRRLELQFSLYRANSAICTLNRTGILVSPDADMVALLKAALQFAELTDGAFDPTVQPLWQLYADHFSSDKPDPEGPPKERLAEALAKVGRSHLFVSEDRIALRHGAAITLNGIAQGYATDRVVEQLRGAGLSATLVDMGEIRAIGGRAEGTPWRVGLADPDRPGVFTEIVDLVDRAVSTSAGAGFRFELQGPVYASVRSRDGPQSLALHHAQRHRADGNRGRRPVDGVQPDAGIADPGDRGRSSQCPGSCHDVRRKFDRMRGLMTCGRAD